MKPLIVIPAKTGVFSNIDSRRSLPPRRRGPILRNDIASAPLCWNIANLFLIFCITLFLTACNPLTPIKVEEVTHYTLNQYPTERYVKASHATLLVAQPLVDTSLSSNRMFYTDKTFVLKAYALSDWATPPAVMLQNLIVKSLNHSQLFNTVLKEPIMIKSDYRLFSTIYLLQQEFIGDHANSHLQVAITLMDSKQYKVIATRLFDVSEPMSHNTPYEGVIAMNQAIYQFLKQLNQFVRVHTHAAAQRTDITSAHVTPLATPFV